MKKSKAKKAVPLIPTDLSVTARKKYCKEKLKELQEIGRQRGLVVRGLTEEEAQNALRYYVYSKWNKQSDAAPKLKTTVAHLGHVLNGRKALTKAMQKAIKLTRQVVIQYS